MFYPQGSEESLEDGEYFEGDLAISPELIGAHYNKRYASVSDRVVTYVRGLSVVYGDFFSEGNEK